MNSAYVDRCKPFKVRTGCGHVVIRMMREATAGVPWTEETIIEAPNGRTCDECEQKRTAPNWTRRISCGCCTNGCCCVNHMDIPNGRRPQVCEYHSASGHIEFLKGGAA